jgi:hypothetical protein
MYPMCGNDSGRPAAARSPKRRYRRVIDAHIHWPPGVRGPDEEKARPTAPSWANEKATRRDFGAGVHADFVMRKFMTNLDDIIAAMERRKVAPTLSMTNPLMYWRRTASAWSSPPRTTTPASRPTASTRSASTARSYCPCRT